jgi:hypothetical protein
VAERCCRQRTHVGTEPLSIGCVRALRVLAATVQPEVDELVSGVGSNGPLVYCATDASPKKPPLVRGWASSANPRWRSFKISGRITAAIASETMDTTVANRADDAA